MNLYKRLLIIAVLAITAGRVGWVIYTAIGPALFETITGPDRLAAAGRAALAVISLLNPMGFITIWGM